MKSNVIHWAKVGLEARRQQIHEEQERLKAELAEIAREESVLLPTGVEAKLKADWEQKTAKTPTRRTHATPGAYKAQVARALALISAQGPKGISSTELRAALKTTTWGYRQVILDLIRTKQIRRIGHATGRHFVSLSKHGPSNTATERSEKVLALLTATPTERMNATELRAAIGNPSPYLFNKTVEVLKAQGHVTDKGQTSGRVIALSSNGSGETDLAAKAVAVLQAQPEKQMLSLHLRPILKLKKDKYRKLIRSLTAAGRVTESGFQVGRRITLVD